MSKTRTWVFGMLAAMLVVAIGGWMLGISPIVDQISAANAQTTSIEASNQSSQAQLASLKLRFAGVNKLRANLDKLRLSIPEEQSASAFLDEVNELSQAAGASVVSVIIANATLYTAPTPTPAAGAPATTDTSTATPSPSATAVPTVPAAPTNTAGQLVIIPVTVNVEGTLAQGQQFVKLLQTGQRLFVSSTMTVSSGGGLLSTSVTGDIFTLQGTSDPVTTKTVTPIYSTATPTPVPTPTGTTAPSSTKVTTGGATSPSIAPSTAPTATPTPTDSASTGP